MRHDKALVFGYFELLFNAVELVKYVLKLLLHVRKGCLDFSETFINPGHHNIKDV